ncbi:ABC transporter substrate-binding protein [Actinomadura violacea]|uniref:ABC transporter substrate-binding protein n=1 Tax=Actinomadura violacea TaxID=2819934 RepID=A0ABS3S7B9_9ACTN|nr:ABC transporter substrate-binding protein [Actinomadura violacea]MBO2464899.1 ABC transporter substrate-binding protein [Actinomadura violacea]
MRRRSIQVGAGLAAVFVAGPIALTGCDGGSSSSKVVGPVKTAQPVKCDAEPFGPITRCKNFYTAYWPTLKANMDALYKHALETDGGQLVVWDWYELSPDLIKAFTKRFPGIKVKTRGLNYNLSSAIISAKATGARNTDVVSGSITSITAMYDQGFWEKVDWTKFGVPKEWFDIGAPELLPDSINGPLVAYNTAKVKSVPTSWTDFLAPQWNGKIAMSDYEAQDFSGYGMKYGKDKMVQLIKDLKGRAGLTVTNNPGTLLANGDKPVMINGPLFDPNPKLAVSPVDTENMYVQFSGVNKYGSNKPAAELFLLWNAYDPDWLRTRMTDKRFLTLQTPFPGLPESVFQPSSGVLKRNQAALFTAVRNGWTIFETQANRDKYNELIKAADDAMGK